MVREWRHPRVCAHGTSHMAHCTGSGVSVNLIRTECEACLSSLLNIIYKIVNTLSFKIVKFPVFG